jgi:hypothetical protein
VPWKNDVWSRITRKTEMREIANLRPRDPVTLDLLGRSYLLDYHEAHMQQLAVAAFDASVEHYKDNATAREVEEIRHPNKCQSCACRLLGVRFLLLNLVEEPLNAAWDQSSPIDICLKCAQRARNNLWYGKYVFIPIPSYQWVTAHLQTPLPEVYSSLQLEPDSIDSRCDLINHRPTEQADEGM